MIIDINIIIIPYIHIHWLLTLLNFNSFKLYYWFLDFGSASFFYLWERHFFSSLIWVHVSHFSQPESTFNNISEKVTTQISRTHIFSRKSFSIITWEYNSVARCRQSLYRNSHASLTTNNRRYLDINNSEFLLFHYPFDSTSLTIHQMNNSWNREVVILFKMLIRVFIVPPNVMIRRLNNAH